MPAAISNTSPLLYLHRVRALHLLPEIFGAVWAPEAVVLELEEGARGGHDVPNPTTHEWLEIVNPLHTPSGWLALDLGAGEVAAMALALENPGRIILLDDALARRTAQAAGLEVWGTLRVLLEAKSAGLIDRVSPFVDRLVAQGLWVSEQVRLRLLALAGE